MSYTHIKIDEGSNLPGLDFKIKLHDFATLLRTDDASTMYCPSGYIVEEGTYLEFAEDPGNWYHERLFKELPRPKVQYVAVAEELKEELAEPLLN
jgi:ABC-type dipeptide/oligopeptide/nickel transport system ATPase component